MSDNLLKLNLGCGNNKHQDFINVDQYGDVDVLHDLEVFPWPWQDNSVSEVLMIHVLEHLGQQTKTFLSIMQELYRICVDGAQIKVHVPHPRHDDFLNDPTHVRPITPDTLEMFCKKTNEYWLEQGFANSTLALATGVDFSIIAVQQILDKDFVSEFNQGDLTEEDAGLLSRRYNNVIKEYQIQLVVNKS